MKYIAHIESDFPTKFGIPRQSGLTDTVSKIIFEPEYRLPDAVRGLEEFSHIWLIWEFSLNKKENFSATVRPPRLGGNERLGVFATRSPFRPNSIGLSSVKLEKIEFDEKLGPILYILGADLADGTPIFDIKPYIAYTDSHPQARCGFSDRVKDYRLEVSVPDDICQKIESDKLNDLMSILSQDPRPSYQNDPERLYGFEFAGYEIKFKVCDNLLTVVDIK